MNKILLGAQKLILQTIQKMRSLTRAPRPTIELDYAFVSQKRDIRRSAGGSKIEQMIHVNLDLSRQLLFHIELLPWLDEIGFDEPSDPREPFWLNGWFPPLDALSLCALLTREAPKLLIEIGSGNSTKFARRTITQCQLQTRIISIDPEPRTEIDAICDEVIRTPLEQIDLQIFANLQPNDMLFIDSSHLSFMNTDVTVSFLEIIPALRSGVIYGLHDIFLPDDYPASWTDRFYNEQYLLATYLLGGAEADQILFPSWYLSQSPQFTDALDHIHEKLGLEASLLKNGACFWLRKA